MKTALRMLFIASFLIGAMVQAERPAPMLIYVITSPLTGELNALSAIARELRGRVVYVEAETLALQDEIPDVVLHALAVEDEVSELYEYKRKHKQVRLVNLGDPLNHRKSFDVILSASHLPRVVGDNVVVYEGVPSQINLELLTRAHPKTSSPQLNGPAVAVLIGGSSKAATFSEAHARSLAQTLNTLREKTGARFFITNSRRTTDAVTAKFREILRPPVDGPNRDVFVDWKLAAEARAAYIQYLAEADHIVVTGDSMSMIADALTTGKPTYVFAPAGSLEDRHKAFVLEQAKRGRLRPLGTGLERFTYEPLDASKAIANTLRSRWVAAFPGSAHTCQRLFDPTR